MSTHVKPSPLPVAATTAQLVQLSLLLGVGGDKGGARR